MAGMESFCWGWFQPPFCAAEAPLSFNGIRLDAGEAEILQRFPGAPMRGGGCRRTGMYREARRMRRIRKRERP